MGFLDLNGLRQFKNKLLSLIGARNGIAGLDNNGKILGNELPNYPATQGGTDITIVTSGERYSWNNKISNPSNVQPGKYLQTDQNGNPVWGEGISVNAVSEATAEWLDEHVPTGQTLIVDTSLSLQNAAAESSTVGTHVSSINAKLDAMDTAVASDVGMALKAKTVSDGHVTEWEFGEVSGIDDTAGRGNTVKTWSANKLSGEISEMKSQIEDCEFASTEASNLATQVNNHFNQSLQNIVQGAEVQDNALYLLNENGDVVAGPFEIGGGDGGGGGSVNFSFASATGQYAYTYSSENQVVLDLVWSSVEDEVPTGNGTLKLTVNGAVKFSKGVPQGTLHENVTAYLSPGDNTLIFQLTDAYGNRRNRTFTVSFIDLRLTSSFDDSVDQTGTITFPYTPYGNLPKTIHFLIDNVEVATASVASYGRQLSQILPAQTHGSHTLTVYATATINEEQVSSNTLYYDVVCVNEEYDDVIIASSYNKFTVDQYTTVNIPYRVYTPRFQTSNVTISVDGVVVQDLVDVDRTVHTFSYRLDTSGSTTISITSGNAVKLILLTVNHVDIDVEAETEGLKLYLSSYGRSNREPNPAIWTYDNGDAEIAATFSGFNWINDGWVLDDDGVTVMRVSSDARITIPYKPFETDKRTSGFTIEIDFATRDVRNYDSVICSCMDNGRGFELTSQRFTLSSEGSSISMQFKENEHVRATFVVEKRTNLRLIYCYINGVMSGVTRYPTSDNFAQNTPQNITIGSSNSTIDIYTIRIYDNDLPMKQVEANWIADTPDGSEMIARYTHNNVRDASDQISISKLPADLPYMIITCPELSQYKGDKKQCSGSYVDPVNADKSFTFEGCEINVQGTSSQYYSRKNYTMKFNGGFTNNSGVTSSKYQLRANSIPEKQFVMKADVASSEGANNVELVRLYNDSCPYRTPAQESNPNVRQGIDGFPIVIFWNNPDTNIMTFLGKYNFNNAKGTENTFGFTEGDESWEVLVNTSNRVIYKSNDFESTVIDEKGKVVPAWRSDFEGRYPDEDYVNTAQLKEFITWVMSTDPTTATNNALPETADFGETSVEIINGEAVVTHITYSTDSPEYRRAKFRAELSNYAEVDSLMFYYLFTELFLMVDSRAKNSFPSFIGTSIGGNNNE